MQSEIPHISVCICTYKRTQKLAYLLGKLGCQETHDLFTYSIVVADNDAARSAETVVCTYGSSSLVPVTYCVEPTQNIALVRNAALGQAVGEFVAFIDDDEFPVPNWLHDLFQTLKDRNVDGVLGPVIPRFEQPPPAWLQRGGFCDRPTHQTGFEIGCTEGRTGNLLLKRDILGDMKPVFRPEYGGGGEDRDLFRRMIAIGRTFVWCNEAVVYEWVPASRMKRAFMLRRALLRGKMSTNNQRGLLVLFRSFFAVAVYSAALPFLLVAEHSIFMKCLVSTCDHAGRLLAALRINPIRENYIVE